jgi:hypothetical protein
MGLFVAQTIASMESLLDFALQERYNPHSAGWDSKIIFFIGTAKQRNDFYQLHISNPG